MKLSTQNSQLPTPPAPLRRLAAAILAEAIRDAASPFLRNHQNRYQTAQETATALWWLTNPTHDGLSLELCAGVLDIDPDRIVRFAHELQRKRDYRQRRGFHHRGAMPTLLKSLAVCPDRLNDYETRPRKRRTRWSVTQGAIQ